LIPKKAECGSESHANTDSEADIIYRHPNADTESEADANTNRNALSRCF
jgi:hypothetical protein